MEFQGFKDWLIVAAKQADACASQYKRALESQTWEQLLTVVKENANWLYSNNIITTDSLVNVPDEILLENGIYVKKTNVTQNAGLAIYYSSTSEHYGSSTSNHYDSSTSKHYGSSTSNHYDSSTSEHYGSSTSEHYGSSTSNHYGSSTSKHYGSSTYGSVYELKDTSIIHDQAIVRERSSDKIYMKKGAFEIVQID